MSTLLIVPQAWAERYAPLPDGWWSTHGLGLQRVWPECAEVIDRVAREVGIDPRLLVTRMELEQGAIGYAWDGTTRDYEGGRLGEQTKLRYLCGVDKTDSGPRAGGWFGPERQCYGAALRFKCLYRGQPIPLGLESTLPPLPREVAALREDARFAPGVPVTRGGETVVPPNQASADCLRYTTSLPGSRRLAEIGRAWFPADYEAEEAGTAPAVTPPESGREDSTMSKLIILDAGHPPGGGAAGVGGNEATLNGLIREALTPMLQAAGHRVHLCQRTDSVSNIGRESAALRGDVFVSIHHNAGGGSGTEAYIAGAAYNSAGDPNCAPEGRKLATTITTEIMDEFGITAHGTAVRNVWAPTGVSKQLGVLAGGSNWAVTGAACLLEMMFVDNAAEAKVLRASDYPRRAAAAIYRGIQRYLGLEADTPETSTEQPESHAEKWGELVRTLQAWLAEHGFDPGPIDGIYGPTTAAAMAACQQAG